MNTLHYSSVIHVFDLIKHREIILSVNDQKNIVYEGFSWATPQALIDILWLIAVIVSFKNYFCDSREWSIGGHPKLASVPQHKKIGLPWLLVLDSSPSFTQRGKTPLILPRTSPRFCSELSKGINNSVVWVFPNPHSHPCCSISE